MAIKTSIIISLVIFLVCIYMFIPIRHLDDVALHRYMIGVSGNVQLTTIPAITNIGKVEVFPFCVINQTVDWKTILYSFNLEPGNGIVYDHGRWRAQSYTYTFEGTKLYRTDTLTHERQLFMEFNLGKNFQLNDDNQIVTKPYCKQSGKVPIEQSPYSRFYETETVGENLYSYGYWFCNDKDSEPELVLCQNQKFDLKLVLCRDWTECETKANNYIWPDLKDVTKYFQCDKDILVHGTCPESNPIFNGLRCINPICKPLLADNCRVPHDNNSFFLCNGLEATKVNCAQGVDLSGINCLYTCKGSTVFVQKFLDTLQVTPQRVLVGQTACIDGKIVKRNCAAQLVRKMSIKKIKNKLHYYWAPINFLKNGNCKPYTKKPSLDEMVQFPDTPDPAIASHITSTGKVLSKLIPYEQFASFPSDRTRYYDCDGVEYKGVLFYFGTQMYILDEKYLIVPQDSEFVLNNSLNGVWTEQLTIDKKVDPEIWNEDKANDCDCGLDIPGLYYVNKTGTAMCLEGKPTLNICHEHGMTLYNTGCRYFGKNILTSIGEKVKERARMTGKKISGTYKGIYSATNSLWVK